MSHPRFARFPLSQLSCAALCLLAGMAGAQTPQQVVKPPKTVLWMDVSTGGMAGMPELEIPGMGGLMGGLMGGMGRGNPDARATNKSYYGAARTFHLSPPRIVDVALWNGLKPGVEAQQRIPAGMQMGDALPLLPVQEERVVETSQERSPREMGDYQQPKGRLLFYWGCSATVKPGQPRIVDLSKLGTESAQSFASAFAGRFAPDRGAKVRQGYDVFPNERDQRGLPKGASLVGEHRVTGDGVPDSFRFALGAAQDVMPAIELQSRGTLKDSVALSWIPVTNAKGYFLNAMGAQGDDMVFWSSSETPDTGFGLFDFLSNADIAKWTKEKVLLDANATDCAVPQGIFQPGDGAGSRRGRSEGGAMLRMIAYGGEHGFVHPPRPTDPKVPWEQEWSVRLRVKSQTMAMLGQDMDGAEEGQGRRGRGMARPQQQPNPAQEGNEPPAEKSGNTPSLPNPFNAIKGIFGR